MTHQRRDRPLADSRPDRHKPPVVSRHQSACRVVKGAFPWSTYRGFASFGEEPEMMTSEALLPGCTTWLLLDAVEGSSLTPEIVSKKREKKSFKIKNCGEPSFWIKMNRCHLFKLHKHNLRPSPSSRSTSTVFCLITPMPFSEKHCNLPYYSYNFGKIYTHRIHSKNVVYIFVIFTYLQKLLDHTFFVIQSFPTDITDTKIQCITQCLNNPTYY